MRRASFADHRTFCRVDGWTRKADAPGRAVSKHEVWTKVLSDGSVLRTSVSKARGRYGPGLFTRIVKRQLRVTTEQFWLAVDKGERPPRDLEDARAPGTRAPGTSSLPLAAFLRLRAKGYSDAEIRALSRAEVERLTRDE